MKLAGAPSLPREKCYSGSTFSGPRRCRIAWGSAEEVCRKITVVPTMEENAVVDPRKIRTYTYL
jgi:hypothetical protein